MRLDHDTMGAVEVPDNSYWGAQTQRSIQNFKIGPKQPWPLIQALALLKKAAARVNTNLGILPQEWLGSIEKACDEVLDGTLKDQFPLVVFQTGSGTQTNMNMNEVLANRANELMKSPLGSFKPIHPNDHINKGQSSNDSFPTAMHIATALQLIKSLIPQVDLFIKTLQEKQEAFKDFIKIGRTHLQDATPITLGQEFSAFSQQMIFNKERLESTLPRLYLLAQGGTAVGTGLNCHPQFAELFAKEMEVLTQIPFKSAPNKFEALSSHDTLVEVSGALNVMAVSCMKLANDIRFLASGPRCGLGELNLPENEPGSSIMPGKVNPTQAEALTMVCAKVMGNHTTITVAGSQGHFQLNVFKPIIIDALLGSIELFTQALESFRINCLEGLEVNKDKLTYNLEHSLMLVTALNPHIGYENAAKVAKKALRESISLKQAAVELNLLTGRQFDEWVKPQDMV
ncbi:MAG TPA: class II fumarate hydratase [Alphaproteobacteria bacterium]|nr:class II fumarate hydratase [Alphaproteobacteria bacterium]